LNRSVKDGKKTCTLCKETKPVEEFGRRGGKTKFAHHVKSRCKKCECEERKKHAVKKRLEDPLAHRKYWLNYKYGITLEEYDYMFKVQNGVCAICNEPETKIDPRSGEVKILSVDHCHNSGEVRALLCDDCNVSLGKMKDNPTRLGKAAEYIRSACEHSGKDCLHDPPCASYRFDFNIR
jgi:hypothetical protein